MIIKIAYGKFHLLKIKTMAVQELAFAVRIKRIIFAKILLVFHNIILTKAKASIRVVFRCI